MTKRLAVYLIGAGPLALKMFKWAKQLELLVVATDRNANAAGRKSATFFECIDASDNSGKHEAFILRLRKEGIEICGVYCGNEIGTTTANRLQNFLGLPSNSVEAMAKSSDKVKMKNTWSKYEIDSPRFRVLRTMRELREFLEESSFEQALILKPTLGSGSRGVQIVSSKTEICHKKIWQLSMEPVNYEGHLLVEEYILGRQLDANGIFFNNKYFKAGTLEKFISNPPNCLPICGQDPADINQEIEKDIHNILEKSSRCLGLAEGPVKGDFILSPKNKLYVLEVAPRLHGDVTTCNTLPYGSKCNPLKFLFKAWKTKVPDESLLTNKNKGIAAWRVLCIPPGSLIDNSILETAKNLETQYSQITKIWINPKYDHKKHAYINTSEIPGYICAFGETAKTVNETLVDCLSNLKFPLIKHNEWYLDMGKEISKYGFDTRSFAYKKK